MNKSMQRLFKDFRLIAKDTSLTLLYGFKVKMHYYRLENKFIFGNRIEIEIPEFMEIEDQKVGKAFKRLADLLEVLESIGG